MAPRAAGPASAAPSAAPAARPAAPAGVGAPTPIAGQPPVSPRPAAPTGAAGAGGGARPINPFLANDPNAKARRLARALVSDLISYFPQKREEGLRDGTLKDLFREEIKKSYQEFVEQIGGEFAETTTHFQDALNELLAGGQQVFTGGKSGVE